MAKNLHGNKDLNTNPMITNKDRYNIDYFVADLEKEADREVSVELIKN